MKSQIDDRLVAYIIENQNKFYRLAYSYVRNQEDALDVVQAAVCKALEKEDTLRNKDAVKTWFYSILVHECLILLKERKRTLSADTDSGISPGFEEQIPGLYAEMHAKISRLNPDEQSIIRMRFFEEFSLYEISEIMKMNLSTVKSKLYRGLKKLKIMITEEDLL